MEKSLEELLQNNEPLKTTVTKKEYSIEIDKKKVLLAETIKNIGAFTVDIKLYEGIIAQLKLNVVA